MNRDNSIRQRAIEAFHEERQLFVGGPTVVFKWRAEPGWPVEYVSPNVFEQFGYQPQDFTSGDVPYAAIVHPDDLARVAAEIATHQIEGLAQFEQEYRLRRADGVYRWLYDFTVIVYGDDGAARYFLGYIQDITERKQAEVALRASEERYRLIVETSLEGIWVLDEVGKTTFVNQRMADMLGYTRHDMMGRTLLDFMDTAGHIEIETCLELCRQGIAGQHDFRFTHQNGACVWTIVSANPMLSPDGKFIGVLAMLVEITSRKKLEARLQLQNAALEAAANAILITDHESRIEWANPAFTLLTGYTLAEIQDKKINFLSSGLQDSVFYQALWTTILSGQVWRGRLINKRKDGSLYTEEQTITPMRDDNGRIRHFIAVKQDVTERDRAEQIRLEQERLKISLKKERELNALVRKAVAALSHDVRTPLTVILTAKDMLGQYFDRIDDEKRHKQLNSIDRQLRYVLELLDDMTLVVTGGLEHGVFKPTMVNLPVLCRACLSEIQETIGSQHRFRFVNKGQIELARVDEILVSRILLNLLSNAVKFSPPNSEIRLELGEWEKYIILRIVDQGIGIEPADRPHIFEPFYRAETVAEISGAGLGLNIVKECVERHKGRISVESQVGHGTAFLVELPLVVA